MDSIPPGNKPTPEKRVTIKDVARRTGVSLQTISRVVNNSANVAEPTRQRVLQAIAELGYRRSELARNLNRGRSYTLGAVGSDKGYIGSEVFLGISRQADKLGYSLQLKELSAYHSVEDARQVLHSLADRMVDGILWAIPEVDNNHEWVKTGLLEEIAVPVVFLSMTAHENLSIVAFDVFKGACMAVNHLIASGHKKIGHIAGSLDWWASQERIRGWKHSLQAAGLPHTENLMCAGDWEAVAGQHALNKLLDSHPDLDAVFAANDKMALGAMLAAHQRGLRIPEDLAIIGFDNTPESACYHPPLTTITQNRVLLGEWATRVLVSQVEEKFDPETQGHTTVPIPTLQHELVIRDSAP